MDMKLVEPLGSAMERVGKTSRAISEMNLAWALCVGDPELLSDLRHAGLTWESAMSEYYGIRDSKIQVHRVKSLSPPTEYVLRNRAKKLIK